MAASLPIGQAQTLELMLHFEANGRTRKSQQAHFGYGGNSTIAVLSAKGLAFLERGVTGPPPSDRRSRSSAQRALRARFRAHNRPAFDLRAGPKKITQPVAFRRQRKRLTVLVRRALV